MCERCGCDGSAGAGRTIAIGESLLADNDRAAAHNRAHFDRCGVLVVNMMGTPGAGKTSLLEAIIREGVGHWRIAAIVGDQATQLDADRIAAAGAAVVQVETGLGCHLDAHQIHRALDSLPLEGTDLLIIENVGNLVCPALFKLGEHYRAVVTSPPEGTDKPLKYASMFRAAQAVLLNKVDLLAHVPFAVDEWRRYVAEINPYAEVLFLSALTGEGLKDWIALLVRASQVPPPERSVP